MPAAARQGQPCRAKGVQPSHHSNHNHHFRSVTMKTLTITDLARSERLDRPTMAAVRGGWKMGAPAYAFGDVNLAGTYDSSISATQNLGQMQEVLTATANGSAFVDGVHVDSDVSQRGENKIVRR
jgi:hypothetical protein